MGSSISKCHPSDQTVKFVGYDWGMIKTVNQHEPAWQYKNMPEKGSCFPCAMAMMVSFHVSLVMCRIGGRFGARRDSLRQMFDDVFEVSRLKNLPKMYSSKFSFRQYLFNLRCTFTYEKLAEMLRHYGPIVIGAREKGREEGHAILLLGVNPDADIMYYFDPNFVDLYGNLGIRMITLKDFLDKSDKSFTIKAYYYDLYGELRMHRPLSECEVNLMRKVLVRNLGAPRVIGMGYLPFSSQSVFKYKISKYI